VGLLGVAGGRSQDLRTGWLVNRTSMVTLPDDSGLARTGHICPADPVGLRGAKGPGALGLLDGNYRRDLDGSWAVQPGAHGDICLGQPLRARAAVLSCRTGWLARETILPGVQVRRPVPVGASALSLWVRRWCSLLHASTARTISDGVPLKVCSMLHVGQAILTT